MPPQTKTPPSESRSLRGRGVHHIDTPALVVDLDAMKRNIHRMAEFARKHGVRWRPHAKMHKSAELAARMVEAGATGCCVQKTSEAEAMAAGGVRDIYISNEVIAPQKLARVASLAHRLAENGGQLAIAVDSKVGISGLAEAMNAARMQHGGTAVVIDVFVEIDVGQGRCGVAPGAAAVNLVHEIRRHAALRFAGLQAYHGRAQHLRTPRERREAISAAVESARRTKEMIEAAGVQVPLVTGAGTGTMVCEAASGLYGELQAGSFLYMDADYGRNERDPAQPQFEHALFVKTQVVSSQATHAVCDAGHKSHAIDSGLPEVLLQGPETDLEFANGGDEHGVLRPRGANQRVPQVGDVLWLIPGHCDPTVNLHDVVVGVKGGLANGKIERLIRVDARGALT
jgi:D-serine deaminase-like pyridoxal phosphate-dependent protein